MAAVRPSIAPAASCPQAPASRKTTFARALHRACVILGGAPALALHLRVSEASLRTWLDGLEDPPLDVFLAAVEVLLLSAADVGRA